MSFTIFDKHPGADTGEIGIGLTGEITEIWTFIATDGLHTIEDLRASGLLPEPYIDVHAQNPRLLCRPHKIAQNEDNPALFTVTINWKSEALTPKEKADQQQSEDNPLDRAPRISAETQIMRETTHRDKRGKPKTNAAGDLCDPPLESSYSVLVIDIRRNVTIFPDWAFDYSDAVNSEDFTIKGRLIKKGTAWMAYVKLGEDQNDDGVAYSEARAQLFIRKKRDPVGDELEAEVPSPWQTERLNEGLYALAFGERYRITIDEPDGQGGVFAAGPVPLTASGLEYIKTPDKTIEEYIAGLSYIVDYDHDELDFNEIAEFLWA